MAEVESSTPMLPWIWIIETLASYKEVEASLIYDVIEMVPQLRNGLTKNVTEMVALRCLEDLYAPNNGSRDEVFTVFDSNVRFDPSESCENLLRFILGKAPPDMRLAGGEQLKVDIYSFISHKRTSVPKCTLQQLKDEIRDGTHPYAAIIKGISGLSSANECQRIPSDGGDHNALPQRLHESGTGAENNGEKGNLVPQTLENGYEKLGKLFFNIKSSPCNRDKLRMATENVDVPKSRYVDKAKKCKHHDSSAIASEDGPCENLTVNEIENGNTCVVEPQTSSCAAAKATHHEIHQSSGTLKHGFQLDTLNTASCDDSRKKVVTDEYKDDLDDCCEAEKLSSSDGNGNERVDIFTMKNQFLSSQFTSHNSSAIANETEQTLCVKCLEGGQLLFCTTHDCHLVVHENCLGSSARFDNQGNFRCPFCTYSIVTSEYLEAKKKVSLARKRLAAFMGQTLEPHRGLTDRLHAKEDNPRQRANEDIFDVVQNGHLGETEGNQVDCTRDHVKKVNNDHAQQCTPDKQQSGSLASHLKENSPCREVADFNGDTCHVSSNEQEGEEMMVRGCPNVRGTEGEEDQVPADHRCENGKLPSENREATVHVNRRCTERSIQKEEISDNECDKFITSNVFNKRRRKESKYTYPAIPQLRRTRLPFTAEEEEMIKEGVSRFTNGNEKTIPWKAILEFGANVFLKGRNTTDLKDKWRNMCRGSPKS